ncbi:MAG: lytic transglycosylase domain-containing protein [Arcobacteraceae bacterium]
MYGKQLIHKLLLSSLLLVSSSYCNEAITLQWLEDKPRSTTKDFYIWQFLQQDITPQEAQFALGEAKNVNMILFTRYAKKLHHEETNAIIECINAQAVDLLTQSSDCLALGLTPSKAVSLDYNQKLQAIDILEETYPDDATVLKVFNAPLPFTKLLATPPNLFFKIFNQSPLPFVEEFFNYRIPTSLLDKLSQFEAFNQSISRIVTNESLKNLQESLLSTFDTTKLNHQSLFFLALNALQYEQNELAIYYLEEASKKAYSKRTKDKILFWHYKITQQNELLDELSNSFDINLYSLYAKEMLNKLPNNIEYTINTQESTPSSFDTSDPFAWIEVLENLKNKSLEDIQEYETLFNTQETLPHLAYVYERLSKYQTFYFITPYSQYLQSYDLKRQALMYALAKQESHFIPTAISHSYALGVMQIMPFLSKNIAEELKEPYVIYEQFNPQTNLKYANYHLDYLEKHLVNPLFIAYAYNGGIGFMKRTIEKGFLKKESPYEPFLSMELMSNEESREYGKQVLANYYVYINHLDTTGSTKLSTLLENLQHNFPQ